MNAIFLMNALQTAGHKVTLLDTQGAIEEKDLDKKTVWDTKKFPIKKYLKEANNVDVLVMLGTSLKDSSLEHFKKSGPNKRIIKYACGNNYVIDMERCIFPKEGKEDIFKKYGSSEKNTGSTEGQIALFTHRINHLSSHLKKNHKDFNTERSLVKLVGKRRSLLDYLKKKDINRYRELIKELGIRK